MIIEVGFFLVCLTIFIKFIIFPLIEVVVRYKSDEIFFNGFSASLEETKKFIKEQKEYLRKVKKK